MTPAEDPHQRDDGPLRLAGYLQTGALITRLLALVPMAAFGLFVLLGTFGPGDVLVGALIIATAVVGPAVHGVILATMRDASMDPRAPLRYGSLALVVLDGVTAGVFAIPAVQRGELGFPVLFALVVLFHATNAVLAMPRWRDRAAGSEVGA